MHPSRLARFAALTLTASLVVAACGGDDDDAADTPAPAATEAAPPDTEAAAPDTDPAPPHPTDAPEAPDPAPASPAAPATTAAAAGAECEHLAEPVTLKWGIGYSPAYSHVFVADQLGYFADENITVEFEAVGSPADTLPLLAGGQLDLANAGMSAGMFNAIGRGIDVKIVASHGQYARDTEAPAGFYVRSELIDSGEVTEIADLAGRNLGLAGGLADIGNAGGYLISLVLAEGGLTLKDMNIVNVAVTDSPTAFASGSIDATFMPGQVAPIVVEDDTARPFGDPNVLAERVQGGTLLGPDLIEERPEVARAVLRALFRAAADLQGDYRQDETIVEALIATGEFERDRIVNFPYYYFDPELLVDEESITQFQQIFIDLGGVIESGEVLPYDELVAEDLRSEAYDTFVGCYG